MVIGLPTEWNGCGLQWVPQVMGKNGGIKTTGYKKRFSGDDGTNNISDFANVESNHE